MNPLSAILIDDEPNNLDNLANLLREYCPELIVAGTASSAAAGEALIRQIGPELVFLDIQMPGQSGFDLLRALPAINFELIFVTAYDQYAIQAIRFAAVDYLLKPVSPDELRQAVARAAQNARNKRQNLQLDNLLQLLQQPKDAHRIALASLEETRFVRPADIVRCESDNNYCFFYLDDGEKLTVSRPIYEFEELLRPYGFVRCHQSHLINPRFVKSWVKKDGGYLLFDNGAQAPVSRAKREEVLRVLQR
ncbi:MAG: LytTR family DNA-binding domain-containing protein [Saprospiraceae bacterium]|nr:LytTR family DNA-binding domain-containing protein [Saprospiraceae bacterium]HNL39601.1 LytTR family DNA-binding domain-containing protein [Saprospiraceae bacterium]